MSKYTYRALDSKGKTVKGDLEAANELEVSTQIAKLGYIPLSVSFKPDKSLSLLGRFFRKRAKKVSAKSIIVFTRQFAVIIKASVPVIEGMGVLAEQTEDASLKNALHNVIHDVQGGEKLSEAMSKHPTVFSELYVNTVMAGEAGGVLDKVLMRLADSMENEEETRSDIKSALRYPIMVIFALIIAVYILSTLVIPQFAKVYAGFGSTLPLPTQIMVLVGKALKNYWYITFPSLFSLFYLSKILLATPKGRVWWDGLKFRMVVMGEVYSKIVMLRFSSMLNVLYQAGLPVLRILDIVKITIGNVILSKEIESIKNGVADGKGISGSILGSKFFPRLVGYMISIGEKTGSLPLMLDSLCDYYNLEVKTALKNLTMLIEPLMTLVLGVVVAFMALAIFLPMWNLMDVVKHAG